MDDRRFMANRADPVYDLEKFVRKKKGAIDKFGYEVEYQMEVKHAQKQVLRIDKGEGEHVFSKQLDRCLNDVYNSLMMSRFKRIILKRMYLLNHYHKIMLHSFDINYKFCEHLNRKQKLKRSTMANFGNITRELEELQTMAEVSTISRSSLEVRRQEKRKREEALAFVKPNKTVQGLHLKNMEIVLLSHLKQRKKVSVLSNLVATKMQMNKEQEADEQAFEVYASYVDLVWQNKNNKVAIITLLNPSRLDSMIDVITLFDAKTKTGLLNVYEELDWKIIEAHNSQFAIKEEHNLVKYPEEFQHAINVITDASFNFVVDTQNSQRSPL
mmetsp:Transcript_33448/g.51357  ORF Transcript_33448/g.51357 Transcript_33448/m.51357 type:complete len:327 (+) Transcript_33448:4119-5099(+)